ncbi:MFS transporter [Teredinibacter sp. KSP-S5-2]|uniref:MFS transporter n=1 Tax=Teredinibacter sp. KSP-S5-2 TaxID=3034506 RepID=UPI00293432A8|nr:MFS transporter [Teredinibacter sp. KSP-S5-2]WNO08180.1 MFS transporter [Teredinibacter sp. KSP-S5-2]
MRSYLHFLSSSWPLLVFGFITVFWGNLGQSFFISWYGESFQAKLGLSAADYGSTYSIATLISGTMVMFVGGWIDRISLKIFVLFVAAGLFSACLMLSMANAYWMLLVGFFLVRLFGQAMMPHTGVTTMARCFEQNRGKAISLATSAMPVGEVILPSLAVLLIAYMGYQNSWLLWAATIPLVMLPVSFLLLKKSEKLAGEALRPQSDKKEGDSSTKGSIRAELLRDPRFWKVIPVLNSAPFVVTGIFIQQSFVLKEKGWSLEWFAVCFAFYGVVHWLSSITSGILVDRYSARKMLRFFQIPMIFALLLVAFVEGQWVAWGMLCLIGMTIGCAGPISGSLWAEVYGTAKIGGIRSLTTTIVVWSTSISPFVLGYLIDQNISLQNIAIGTAVLLTSFSVLSIFSYKPD